MMSSVLKVFVEDDWKYLHLWKFVKPVNGGNAGAYSHYFSEKGNWIMYIYGFWNIQYFKAFYFVLRI